jgi:hypothetical protein
VGGRERVNPHSVIFMESIKYTNAFVEGEVFSTYLSVVGLFGAKTSCRGLHGFRRFSGPFIRNPIRDIPRKSAAKNLANAADHGLLVQSEKLPLPLYELTRQ